MLQCSSPGVGGVTFNGAQRRCYSKKNPASIPELPTLPLKVLNISCLFLLRARCVVQYLSYFLSYIPDICPLNLKIPWWVEREVIRTSGRCKAARLSCKKRNKVACTLTPSHKNFNRRHFDQQIFIRSKSKLPQRTWPDEDLLIRTLSIKAFVDFSQCADIFLLLQDPTMRPLS